MGSNTVLEPIGTSFGDKAPRVEAFFFGKTRFFAGTAKTPP